MTKAAAEMPVGWQLVIAGVLAGAVGVTELVTRYRSEPGKALKSPSAWIYVALNAGSGVGALLLVRAFGWTFGQTQHIALWRILVAGFGAVALFRSSLFVTKIGGTEVGVGPAFVVTALLETFDRDVDRRCAEEIAGIINASELNGLDPQRVMSVLPVLCLALMQNFPPGDQALMGAEIGKIKDSTLPPDAQMRAVTVQLAKYLGNRLVLNVLQKAKPVMSTASAPAAQEQKAAVVDVAKRTLAGEDPTL